MKDKQALGMSTRGQFNSRLGFILAVAGSAVGLGNIWGFPFRVSDGGGAAFVLVYLLCCFLLCFPVMVAEIAIGRKTQLSPVSAFRALGHPKWTILGYLGILSGILILAFYNVIAAWAFGYFIELLLGNFAVGQQFSLFTSDWLKVGLYALLFLSVTAWVVAKGIAGGIEKAARILMPLLLIMILCLAFYGLTLPGAKAGLEFYLIPDFSVLTPGLVYSALGQAFFSLSLGMGALITFGSYLSPKEDIIGAAVWITLMDIGVAFIAGFMLFPLVFSQGVETQGGMGLIFQTLPDIFAHFGPVLGVVLGAGFFLLLSFAAFTSTIALLEVPTSFVVDEMGWKRTKVAWFLALFIFVLGLPSLLSKGSIAELAHFITLPGAGELSFMSFTALIASDSFLPLGGLLISVFVAYVWREQGFAQEIQSSSNPWLVSYVNFAVTYLCPLLLGLMFVITIADNFLGLDVSSWLFGEHVSAH